MTRLMRLVEAHRIDLTPLLTHTFSFDRIRMRTIFSHNERMTYSKSPFRCRMGRLTRLPGKQGRPTMIKLLLLGIALFILPRTDPNTASMGGYVTDENRTPISAATVSVRNVFWVRSK